MWAVGYEGGEGRESSCGVKQRAHGQGHSIRNLHRWRKTRATLCLRREMKKACVVGKEVMILTFPCFFGFFWLSCPLLNFKTWCIIHAWVFKETVCNKLVPSGISFLIVECCCHRAFIVWWTKGEGQTIENPVNNLIMASLNAKNV